MKNSLKSKEDYIKVIRTLDDKPKFFFLTYEQLTPIAAISAICYVIFDMLLGLKTFWWGLTSIWLSIIWLLLAGKNSYEFTDQFWPLPGKGYFNLHSYFVPATEGSFERQMKLKRQPKSQSQTTNTTGGKKQKIVAFQVESDLHGIMELEFGEDKFAILLKCDPHGKWSANIPFALDGIHPELYDAEVDSHAQALSEALKDIPFAESLTLFLGCRSKTRKRINQLRELRRQSKLPLIDLLLLGEELRVEEITTKGLRQEWSQYAFATWTRERQDMRDKSDFLSKITHSLQQSFNSKAQSFAGTTDHHLRNIYVQLANEIYANSYYPWKTTLGTKGGLKLRPLNPQEIWEELLWYRFNSGPAPTIPQIIKVKKIGSEFDYQIKVSDPQNPTDTLSILLAGERGKESCPQHYERRDVVAVNNELVAVASLDKGGTPDGWEDPRDQLNWVWSRISDLTVRDTEIFVQISNGDKRQAHDDLIKISKQSTASNAAAIEEGAGIDVAATLQQDEAIEAQARLHQGAELVFSAVTLLVYRQNLEELDRACTRLINSFSPAKFKREKNVCWKLWLETLPINNLQLLRSTAIETLSERRTKLDTISVRGILPLTKPQNIHQNGLELINKEGGYPLYIDLFKNNERAIITGKSGSGKSILSFGIIKQALAQGIKVVGMDMSNAGESTFEAVTQLLGEQGSYVNILKRSFNVIQPPDLSNFDAETQVERLRIWKNSLREVLIAMAMGQIADQELHERVDSVMLRLLNTFFHDRSIIDRYNEAFDHGWQSSQWQNIPVLEDLLFFCSKEKLGLTDCKEIDERAINQINNQIGAKILDPNIGRAISRPSDLPPSPQMTFFALSGLTNKNNSLVMALVSQMACLNAALESPKSLFVMDECSVLLGEAGFAKVVGQRFATGRKQGQSVLIIGQDIDSIAKIADSTVSSQIITNTDYWLIGKTNSGSAKRYRDVVGVPSHLIRQAASETFTANPQQMYSQWLLCRDDRQWKCLYFPSSLQLGVLANSPDERAARERVFAQYPNTNSGKLVALGQFSQEFRYALISGSPLTKIGLKAS